MSWAQSPGVNGVGAETMKVSKPSPARFRQRRQVGRRRVLDGEAAEQQLVRLGVGVGLRDRMRHVVGLGKEAGGAQSDERQAVPLVGQAAEMFGRELGHAVDVAGPKVGHGLGEPGGAGGPAGGSGADLGRDHQGCGRGEDEAVDGRARGGSGLEQVERALDVGGDEVGRAARRHVRLVQGRGVDDGIDAGIRDRAKDQRAIGDRARDARGRAFYEVEAGDRVPGGLEQRHQGLAEPARGAGDEDAHGRARRWVSRRGGRRRSGRRPPRRASRAPGHRP